MNSLADEKIILSKAGSPPISPDEAAELLPQLPGWSIVHENGMGKLKKEFSLKNFAAALDLTNKIGELAELENHHPAITTEWGGVTVVWWTHTLNGLHRNDFIMAARCERVFQESLN